MQGTAGGPAQLTVAGSRTPPAPGERADHEVTPVAGSARLLDGTPADLTRPPHYPCEAVCTECGGPVRCDRWFRASFYHIARFTLAE